MPRILMVDDDRLLCEVVSGELESLHFQVELVHDGDSALACLKTHQFDLIILDWGLPGTTGLEIARRYRGAGGQTPILFLTAMDQLDDKEKGFNAGADDYLTKPFHIKELVMRLKALLNRAGKHTAEVLTFCSLVLDPIKFRLTRDGVDIVLTRREFQLLEFLMRHPGQVFTGDALLERVWSMESDASITALRACITRIRQKVDRAGEASMIQSLYGLGYKLDLPEAQL